MSRSRHFILDGIEPIEVPIRTWANWFETAGIEDRLIALDTVEDWRVSTVFIGLDHRVGAGPPLIFETMVFGEGWGELFCQRCSTYEQALTIHEIGRLEAVELARKTSEEIRQLIERARP